MADNARKTHVSPGVYSREIELSYAVKSLGITTLGLAGETVKGPAFEPIAIESWADYQDVFGGTSAEKFKGSQYPKYELPYIAKSYLKQSKQLEVCRVLGLSGYNAGPAWAITAKRGDENMVVAVIRSRGYYNDYERYQASVEECACGLAAHDKLHYMVGELPHKPNCTHVTHYNPNALSITDYTSLTSEGSECEEYRYNSGETTLNVSTTNYGKFTLAGFTGVAEYGATEPTEGKTFAYPVSLNPADSDYILKVLGTNPLDGDAPIYVESLYDVALIQGIEAKEINELNNYLTFYDVCYPADLNTIPAVNNFVAKEEGALTRKDLGKRFLYSANYTDVVTTYHTYEIDGKNTVCKDGDTSGSAMEEGYVYTVRAYLDKEGKRHYFYSALVKKGETDIVGDYLTTVDEWQSSEVSKEGFSGATDTSNRVLNASVIVKNNTDNFYYTLKDGMVERVTCDLNDYKSAYRFASTPWIVSNVKGDYNRIELNKLFRFHTITDGNYANQQVKISITNILPDEGRFTVQVRDINDSDTSPVILESYSNCTLVPGEKSYIAYKIGSYDGVYESRSKYITVEVNETTATKNSVPAGFIGYPLAHFDGVPMVEGAVVSGDSVVSPYIKYNCNYDEDIKARKQYFGLSDLVGVDVDMFTFKGNAAYTQDPETLSNGFHLDCRVNPLSYADSAVTLTVEGEEGYVFDTVDANNVTNTLQELPVISTEDDMEGCIFENVNLRKFTVNFYGGFDGWDEYRTQRTTADKYKYSKYAGEYNDATGEGFAFNRINNPELIGLNQKGITSDYYAYLAAIRQFANPESVDINVFATPGIDYVNNQSLVEETIEMIEEERADSIYVVTTPDKPNGASDYIDEMYTADDAIANLEYTEIDSNYTCTYYPWVKYHDTDNNQYIYLPPTKDVVRNMAMTDNVAFPWFAPAGLERGDVECARAHFITKLADEDTLYEGRINPIKTFSQDGVKVWGQKNLQISESQLNRIAVRRLLLRMRKLIAIACLRLIFEPNDATTKDKFLSIVTPILDNIRANRGISDYKIEVDDSIEARERLELPAKIFFKPYNALEYIPIDFVLTPEGVSFEDI